MMSSGETPIAFRINPDVDPKTHKYTTTGKKEEARQLLLAQTWLGLLSPRREEHGQHPHQGGVDAEVAREPDEQGFGLDEVPPKGEMVKLADTGNMSTGGISIDRTFEAHPENVEIAEEAARVAADGATVWVGGSGPRRTLRLAADIWWVLYIALRDGLLAVAFIMSFMFLFPDVLLADALPIGGSIATALLFAVLLTKLVADTDDDPRAFRLVSVLLAVGATIYILPTIVGVQVSALNFGDPWNGIAQSLVTTTNETLAIALWWISLIAIGVMGAVAVWFNLRTPGMTLGRADR